MTDDWKRHLDRLHAALVQRDDPTELATEADAVDASVRYPRMAIRGPVFGVAVLDPAAGPHWRVLQSVTDAAPQQTRDGLNSLLWFRAKEDVDDPAERRDLLAAVSVLEREPVDELEVRGVRYRVVRGDELARSGDDGLEPPRATDAEPAQRPWDGRRRPPSLDAGFVLEPGHDETSPMAGALRLGLAGFSYTGAGFPADVRADSKRAVDTHPEVVMLPVGFGVAENRGQTWKPHGALMPTPHDARQLLYDAMTETWPLLYDFDARQKASYAQAAERFKAAGRAAEVRVDGRLYRVCRIERMVRFGPDGPEPPRPSDLDDYGPTKIHPTMDENGVIHHDD